MKKNYLIIAGLLLSTFTQAQIGDVLNSIIKEKTGVDLTKTKPTNSSSTNTTTTSNSNINLGNLTQTEISSGLKQALNIGVTEGVKKLGVTDGFYKNDLVKILMPEKLRKIDTTLRSLGMGSLADQGIKLLNRAAEDAVTEATPIFANAITSMTITDAKNILLGNNTAASVTAPLQELLKTNVTLPLQAVSAICPVLTIWISSLGKQRFSRLRILRSLPTL